MALSNDSAPDRLREYIVMGSGTGHTDYQMLAPHSPDALFTEHISIFSKPKQNPYTLQSRTSETGPIISGARMSDTSMTVKLAFRDPNQMSFLRI
jgi:hypothetical protein